MIEFKNKAWTARCDNDTCGALLARAGHNCGDVQVEILKKDRVVVYDGDGNIDGVYCGDNCHNAAIENAEAEEATSCKKCGALIGPRGGMKTLQCDSCGAVQ